MQQRSSGISLKATPSRSLRTSSGTRSLGSPLADISNYHRKRTRLTELLTLPSKSLENARAATSFCHRKLESTRVRKAHLVVLQLRRLASPLAATLICHPKEKRVRVSLPLTFLSKSLEGRRADTLLCHRKLVDAAKPVMRARWTEPPTFILKRWASPLAGTSTCHLKVFSPRPCC